MFLGRDLQDRAEIIYDRGIIELTTGEGTILNMTDLPHLRSAICNRISFVSGEGQLRVGSI